MTKLSIIVLNYNTKDLTNTCIQSLRKQYSTQLESREFEIILVDNASTDGSIEAINNLPRTIPNVQLIKNKDNYGFSRGNNIGAKKAKGKYLFFLNSDTEVQDSGLFGMIRYLDVHENIGVLGGKLYNADGSSQQSAGKTYTFPNVFFMLIKRTMLRRVIKLIVVKIKDIFFENNREGRIFLWFKTAKSEPMAKVSKQFSEK